MHIYAPHACLVSRDAITWHRYSRAGVTNGVSQQMDAGN